MTVAAMAIIGAFDDVVAYFWGAKRDHVNRHDMKYAESWIKAGATLQLCTIVFAVRLSQTFHNEMEPPTSLGALDEGVMTGISRSGGRVVDGWEKDISRWRTRVKAYKEKGTWFDYWGEPPPHNPLIPSDVLKELYGGATRSRK